MHYRHVADLNSLCFFSCSGHSRMQSGGMWTTLGSLGLSHTQVHTSSSFEQNWNSTNFQSISSITFNKPVMYNQFLSVSTILSDHLDHFGPDISRDTLLLGHFARVFFFPASVYHTYRSSQ